MYKELIKLNNKEKPMIKKWEKNPDKHLVKEDIQMSNKHVERC
jgi:hypothetical protein